MENRYVCVWGNLGYIRHKACILGYLGLKIVILYYLGTSDTKKGSALLKKGTEATRARQLKWITSCKVIISISVLLVLLLTIITITIIIITIIVVRVFEEYQVRNSPLVTFLIIRQGLPLRQKTFPAGIFWNQQLIIFWTQERGVYMYKDLVGLCIQFFWKVLVWSDLPYI